MRAGLGAGAPGERPSASGNSIYASRSALRPAAPRRARRVPPALYATIMYNNMYSMSNMYSQGLFLLMLIQLSHRR